MLLQKIFRQVLLLSLLLALSPASHAQSDSCRLAWGINLTGIFDYSPEQPFVDMMHSARPWFTKELDNPDNPWDSGHAHELSYRPDGYPTEIPQTVPASSYPQQVATFWVIDAWKPGTYTILFEGSGELFPNGIIDNLQHPDAHTYTFEVGENLPDEAFLQLIITQSEVTDPIHNIRLIMPGALSTYETQPFNPDWLDLLTPFKTLRFMDWGQTNNWGQPNAWTWNDPALFSWEERAQMNHYTWANEKGVPYEMMVQLMNELDADGWVCVPHRADNEFIQQMATFFRDNLEPERKLYVEYSNEIWNWIFGQTQWLYEYGCLQQGMDWPEGIVPYLQNCLDIWTDVFAGQEERIVRVAGLFTAWQDVSNRIVFNLTPGSFDAVAPTFYFGLSEEGDEALDLLGNSATVADVAWYVRQNRDQEFAWIQEQKETIADSLGLPMVFYEGGQHITPHPFGEEPSYAQALLDLQRDTAIFNLYTEWFDLLRQLNDGPESWLMMHFSFIRRRSARYGSWGLLENMYQDTSLIPAPKYSALLQAIEQDQCFSTGLSRLSPNGTPWEAWPNPFEQEIYIGNNGSEAGDVGIQLYDLQGHLLFSALRQMEQPELSLKLPPHLPKGAYWLRIRQNHQTHSLLLVK